MILKILQLFKFAPENTFLSNSPNCQQKNYSLEVLILSLTGLFKNILSSTGLFNWEKKNWDFCHSTKCSRCRFCVSYITYYLEVLELLICPPPAFTKHNLSPFCLPCMNHPDKTSDNECSSIGNEGYTTFIHRQEGYVW